MASLPDLLRAIDLLGPLFLSGLLVLLYYRQYRLEKVHLQPSIEISDGDADGDQLRVWISNYGGGIAKNLRIETVTFLDNHETAKTETLLQRSAESGERTQERAIGADERVVLFECKPMMATYGIDGLPGTGVAPSFSAGMRDFAEHGETHIGFHLSLKYETQLDEEKAVRFSAYPYTFKLDADERQHVASGAITIDYERAVELGSVL